MRTRLSPLHLPIARLAAGAALVWAACANAASLTPGATGDAAVAGATFGRANLALAAAGGVAFSSSDLTPDYAAARVNDGVIDQSGNSWIPLTTGTSEFVGVKLFIASSVAAVVWHGETGYNGRSGGTWSLQYTTDPDPSGSSTWTEIGSYVYAEPGCASPMPRTYFSFATKPGVTALRLVLSVSGCGVQLAVQEFEAYEPLGSPPTIETQPVGGTVGEGGDFIFTVGASGGETYQWRKDGTAIPGANNASYTLSDAKVSQGGSYSVVVANSAGSITSDAAGLTVTPAPIYATYTEAVLADNPIHYYPLDETSGTTAADLGSLATVGGTFNGGFVLGNTSVDARLGKCLKLDGAPGSLVDLGLFHPGDNTSIEAWANLDPTAANNPQYYAIVARWDGSYELDLAPGDVPNFVVRNQANTFGLAAGPSAALRGQWHHFVGIFGDGVLTLYVDGLKGTEQNVGGGLQNAGASPDRVMIGATRSGTVSSFNFKGLIDEVAIYDYALSAGQIRSHFRASQPGPPSLTIEKAVLLSWPSFPPGYRLQTASDINGPYSDYSGVVFPEANLFKAAVPIGPSQKFFQLFKP